MENTSPHPPENWNLGRSWHFKTFHFWLVENTPRPRKLKFRQILAFQDFSLLTCGEYPPPPHPENWNLSRSWHFKTFHFWLVENTPPPPTPKLKFRQILAFQDFSLLTCGESPPPSENWNLGRSWHFKTFHFWLVENTHPPPTHPENRNLGRSWHFKTFHFWLVENTPLPPPPRKLKFKQILAFQDFSLLTCGEYLPPPPTPHPWKLKFRQILAFQDFPLLTCGEYPPPPENWNLGRSWHFKTFHFWLVENPPHPRKLKFRQILAFQDFSLLTCGESPPPPKIEI